MNLGNSLALGTVSSIRGEALGTGLFQLSSKEELFLCFYDILCNMDKQFHLHRLLLPSAFFGYRQRHIWGKKHLPSINRPPFLKIWSSARVSNPYHQLGRLVCTHYTSAADSPRNRAMLCDYQDLHTVLCTRHLFSPTIQRRIQWEKCLFHSQQTRLVYFRFRGLVARGGLEPPCALF